MLYFAGARDQKRRRRSCNGRSIHRCIQGNIYSTRDISLTREVCISMRCVKKSSYFVFVDCLSPLTLRKFVLRLRSDIQRTQSI